MGPDLSSYAYLKQAKAKAESERINRSASQYGATPVSLGKID